MYTCLIASMVLLGFGIYGFSYKPANPSDVMNTERSSSQTYNCDPSDSNFNPSVSCKTTYDCQSKCQGDTQATCLSSYEYDEKDGLMKNKSRCVAGVAGSNTTCNANLGGELILQPAGENQAGGMTFGCQCRYPYYTSENPGSDKFCQLLPSICPNGNFNWDATKSPPDAVKCECPVGETSMNDINGKPTCVEKTKLGAGKIYKDGKYIQLSPHSGVYPCVGDNNFC